MKMGKAVQLESYFKSLEESAQASATTSYFSFSEKFVGWEKRTQHPGPGTK